MQWGQAALTYPLLRTGPSCASAGAHQHGQWWQYAVTCQPGGVLSCSASRFMKRLHFAQNGTGVRLGNAGASAEGLGCRRAAGLSLRGR